MDTTRLLMSLEHWLRGGSAAAGLLVLVFILWQGVWRGMRRPAGSTTGRAAGILRMPVIAFIGVAWVGVCVALWRPLPVQPGLAGGIALDLVGFSLYASGLGLYLWGARELGSMYRPSSGLGVQVSAQPRLVTSGPYAFIRHPLYAGLQAGAVGGLLLFRSWTFVFVLLSFLTLFLRARREEEALALEFGETWEAYASQVPFWTIRLRSKSG